MAKYTVEVMGWCNLEEALHDHLSYLLSDAVPQMPIDSAFVKNALDLFDSEKELKESYSMTPMPLTPGKRRITIVIEDVE